MEAGQQANTEADQSGRRHEVDVKVSFPLAGKGPFGEEVPRTTTAEAVRVNAMAHFGVADDSTEHYYLTHDGRPVDPAETVGAIAGEADSVRFILAKELIQG